MGSVRSGGWGMRGGRVWCERWEGEGCGGGV